MAFAAIRVRRKAFFHPAEEHGKDPHVLAERVPFQSVPSDMADVQSLLSWAAQKGAVAVLISGGWLSLNDDEVTGELASEFEAHFRLQAASTLASDWGDDLARRISSSSIDNKATIGLQGLDVATGQLRSGCMPAFFNYRPPYATPGMPLTLAHPAFGRFMDTFEGVGEQPQQEDSDFFLRMAATFSSFFTEEADYRNHATQLWKQYTGIEFVNELSTGGGEFGARNLARRALFASLEAKLGFFCSKSDPGMQAAQYVRLYWWYKGDLGCFSNTCYPAITIEQLGCNIRVCAVATLDKFCCMPLTPFLNLLLVQGHHAAAAEQGVRLCLAVKLALQELSVFYSGFQQGPRRDSFFRRCIPYPLHNLEVPPTGYRDKLVYLVKKAGQLTVVKFVQRQYGEAVHRAWAAAGYAPELRDVSRILGGWWQVSMEYLGEGWQTLQACSRADELRPRVLAVLAEAQQVRVNAAGGVGVHGDMRDVNVMVKCSEDGTLPVDGGVRFIDFDWARPQGDPTACYPHFMNHLQVNWPEGVQDGKPMLQEHDMALLSLDQDAQQLGVARSPPLSSWGL